MPLAFVWAAGLGSNKSDNRLSSLLTDKADTKDWKGPRVSHVVAVQAPPGVDSADLVNWWTCRSGGYNNQFFALLSRCMVHLSAEQHGVEHHHGVAVVPDGEEGIRQIEALNAFLAQQGIRPAKTLELSWLVDLAGPHKEGSEEFYARILHCLHLWMMIGPGDIDTSFTHFENFCFSSMAAFTPPTVLREHLETVFNENTQRVEEPELEPEPEPEPEPELEPEMEPMEIDATDLDLYEGFLAKDLPMLDDLEPMVEGNTVAFAPDGAAGQSHGDLLRMGVSTLLQGNNARGRMFSALHQLHHADGGQPVLHLATLARDAGVPVFVNVLQLVQQPQLLKAIVVGQACKAGRTFDTDGGPSATAVRGLLRAAGLGAIQYVALDALPSNELLDWIMHCAECSLHNVVPGGNGNERASHEPPEPEPSCPDGCHVRARVVADFLAFHIAVAVLLAHKAGATALAVVPFGRCALNISSVALDMLRLLELDGVRVPTLVSDQLPHPMAIGRATLVKEANKQAKKMTDGINDLRRWTGVEGGKLSRRQVEDLLCVAGQDFDVNPFDMSRIADAHSQRLTAFFAKVKAELEKILASIAELMPLDAHTGLKQRIDVQKLGHQLIVQMGVRNYVANLPDPAAADAGTAGPEPLLKRTKVLEEAVEEKKQGSPVIAVTNRKASNKLGGSAFNFAKSELRVKSAEEVASLSKQLLTKQY